MSIEEPVATEKKSRHLVAYWEMLLSAGLGLLAAFVLSIEAISLAENPAASLSCDLSAKISCSTVGLSWQAQLLGFPNAFLGILFESVVITVAIAALLGTKFPRSFMLGVQALYAVALGFAYWLFIQAYFFIGALCPWCLLVTVTTLLVFTSLLRVNILDGNITFGRATDSVRYWVRLGADWCVCLIVIAILAAMVVVRYL